MTLFLALLATLSALAACAIYVRFEFARMTWGDEKRALEAEVKHLQQGIESYQALVAKEQQLRAELMKYVSPPKWVADWRRS